HERMLVHGIVERQSEDNQQQAEDNVPLFRRSEKTVVLLSGNGVSGGSRQCRDLTTEDAGEHRGRTTKAIADFNCRFLILNIRQSAIVNSPVSTSTPASSPPRFHPGARRAWNEAPSAPSAHPLPLPRQSTSWPRRTGPSLPPTRSLSARSSSLRARSAETKWCRGGIHNRSAAWRCRPSSHLFSPACDR